MIDDDLSVFFDTDEFAEACVRKRAGIPDLPFVGILGLEDTDALQGYSTAARRALLVDAAVDVRSNDTIEVRRVDAGVQTPVGTYRVLRDPERRNDGRTALISLSSIA